MKITKISFFCLLSCFLFALTGCKEEKPEEPIFNVSPDEIILSNEISQEISLFFECEDDDTWSIESKPEWLTISPEQGTSSENYATITFTGIADGLTDAEYPGEVRIHTENYGDAILEVSLYHGDYQLITVNKTHIKIKASESSKKIIISKIGGSLNGYECREIPSWLYLDNFYGTFEDSSRMEITVNAVRNNLEAGTYEGSFIINHYGVNDKIVIDVSMDVTDGGALGADVSELKYGYSDQSKSFVLTNEGTLKTSWTLGDENNNIFSAMPSSGDLEVGESVSVTLNLERDPLPSGTTKTDVIFKCNNGQDLELPVEIKHFKDNKIPISGVVKDAEYSRAKDVLLIVTEEPHQLIKYDTKTGELSTLELDSKPNCISVDRNGEFAAVGKDLHFDYINLNNMEKEGSYEVAAYVHDIVLAPNGWVYVVREYGQHIKIKCIKLETGEVTDHIGFTAYNKSSLILDYTNQFLYGLDYGNMRYVTKYDIREGVAELMYQSTNAYTEGSSTWIADNGKYIFTKGKDIYTTSENFDEDLIYTATLVGDDYLTTLDFNSNAGIIAAIFENGGIYNAIPLSEISIFESEYFSLIKKITLPVFLIEETNGSTHFSPSLGYYGFLNTSGSEFYVVAKADDDPFKPALWAIEPISTSNK